LTADEASVLVGGFEEIYALVLDHELAAVRSGLAPEPFVAPKDLDSLSRRQLRETLRAIARVQQRVDLDWIRRLTK
jgi:CBS domain-containing protein